MWSPCIPITASTRVRATHIQRPRAKVKHVGPVPYVRVCRGFQRAALGLWFPVRARITPSYPERKKDQHTMRFQLRVRDLAPPKRTRLDKLALLAFHYGKLDAMPLRQSIVRIQYT